MKKLFILILIAGQSLLAQEQWYQCLHSYNNSQSSLIDIRYGQVNGHNTMIFRNGQHFIGEELNVYYKNKFWKAPLEISEGFYSKKIVSLRLGEDRLCLKRDFRWILTDRSELSAFSESQCGGDNEVITMRENSQDRHPTAEDVLEYKLQKDVKFQADCVAGRAAGGCDASYRRENFERLNRWNTDSCEAITRLQDIVQMRTEAVQIFNSTAANATEPN